MPVNNENFDQLKIDKLKHFLDDMAAKGQPRPYEIFVDGLKVVPKTEDPKDFENYEYYMNENTEKIRMLIYNTANSPRNDQYNFLVQKSLRDKSLNGLGEIDTIIQEKLAARDKEYETAKLKEELEEIKQQLEEAEEYSETLEAELEDLKANRFKLGNLNMGELASVALEGIVRRNPQILSKLPGGEALAGIIEQDNSDKMKGSSADVSPEGEASFNKKKDVSEGLSEEQKRHSAFLSQLEQTFNEDQLSDVMLIIQKLAEQPAQLAEVKTFLKIQTS